MSMMHTTEGRLIPVVLIAEDHEDVRKLTKLLVEMEGCCPIEAANGLEAFQAAVRLKLHLVLMDIDMPVMDGIEAVRCLRQNDCGRDVPIVAVTAGNGHRRSEAIAAGCNDFLQKPLMPEILRDALAKYVYSGMNYASI